MRILNLLMVSYMCCTLAGCSSMNASHSPNNQNQKITKPTPVTTQYQKKKNPMEVSVYPSAKNLNNPYTVIGIAKVSNYNKGGIKRQDAIIHDAMRTVAASMGGDAIIDIKRTNKSVIGKVIAYQAKVVV